MLLWLLYAELKLTAADADIKPEDVILLFVETYAGVLFLFF